MRKRINILVCLCVLLYVKETDDFYLHQGKLVEETFTNKKLSK